MAHFDLFSSGKNRRNRSLFWKTLHRVRARYYLPVCTETRFDHSPDGLHSCSRHASLERNDGLHTVRFIVGVAIRRLNGDGHRFTFIGNKDQELAGSRWSDDRNSAGDAVSHGGPFSLEAGMEYA